MIDSHDRTGRPTLILRCLVCGRAIPFPEGRFLAYVAYSWGDWPRCYGETMALVADDAELELSATDLDA